MSRQSTTSAHPHQRLPDNAHPAPFRAEFEALLITRAVGPSNGHERVIELLDPWQVVGGGLVCMASYLRERPARWVRITVQGLDAEELRSVLTAAVVVMGGGR